ncbi:hypothetical protein ERJ75_001645400 [Trypanosoma vivax]|uniref:Uncharacterized protein n=1 Tax=Trypanosoma vivax (strain Y486) TaxID=1055687 RepID=G0U988_TRYVY|nr:hypothetical protein TRVL_04637 [Trypanosoma vivax]KAH8605153.1 hypothetical protein ERJ75_001645400 [Trypanosoma vivax]CCC54173.1 conserved hypothetical protein [Trypanosoma vivax Y486]
MVENSTEVVSGAKKECRFAEVNDESDVATPMTPEVVTVPSAAPLRRPGTSPIGATRSRPLSGRGSSGAGGPSPKRLSQHDVIFNSVYRPQRSSHCSSRTTQSPYLTPISRRPGRSSQSQRQFQMESMCVEPRSLLPSQLPAKPQVLPPPQTTRKHTCLPGKSSSVKQSSSRPGSAASQSSLPDKKTLEGGNCRSPVKVASDTLRNKSNGTAHEPSPERANGESNNVRGDASFDDASPANRDLRRSRPSNCRSAHPASLGKAVRKKVIREWESACIMEQTIRERRDFVASELSNVQRQIENVQEAVMTLRLRHYNLLDRLRSFRELQSEVVAEERKNRHMQQVALDCKETVERFCHVPMAQSPSTAASEGEDNEHGLLSMVRLFEQRSLLRKQKAELESAILSLESELLEKFPGDGPDMSFITSLQRMPSGCRAKLEKCRFLDMVRWCRLLRQNIKCLKDRERRIVWRTRETQKRSEDLRVKADALNRQLEQQKMRWRRIVRAPSRTARKAYPSGDEYMSEEFSRCFLTELTK